MRKFVLLFILITLPVFGTEIIDKRKQLYQKNNDNMKLIYSAISSGNFEQVIKSAGEIEAFANKMTDYFPIGSVSRGSSENIWSDFEGFTNFLSGDIPSLELNILPFLDLKISDSNLDDRCSCWE